MRPLEDAAFRLRNDQRVYSSEMTHLSPLARRFWTLLPLGLLSLPRQWTPPGPVTRRDSRPLEDFLNVNSTVSPSFRLRKPSMCSLLWERQTRTLSVRSLDQLHIHTGTQLVTCTRQEIAVRFEIQNIWNHQYLCYCGTLFKQKGPRGSQL